MSKPKLDIRKRFLQLAYNQLNPDFSKDFMAGLEQYLTTWYCFQYNVPPNDDKMMSMTLEELLVLHQMHKLRENPHLADEITSEAQSYEDWLKQEMGEDYISVEEMIARAEALEREDKKIEEEIVKDLPDRITTDFNKIGLEDDNG